MSEYRHTNGTIKTEREIRTVRTDRRNFTNIVYYLHAKFEPKISKNKVAF